MDRGGRRGGRSGRGGRRGTQGFSPVASAQSVGQGSSPYPSAAPPMHQPSDQEKLQLISPSDYRAYFSCYSRFGQAPPVHHAQLPPRMMSPEDYDAYYDFYQRFSYAPPIPEEGEQVQVPAQEGTILETPVQSVGLAKFLKEVRNLGCRVFSGSEEALIAKDWIESVSCTFDDIRLPLEHRLPIVTRLLEKEARSWWKTVEMRHPAGVSWAIFRQEFEHQYFTSYHQQQAQSELFRLRQGNLTIDEYMSRLRQLAAVLPVPMSESQLCCKFEDGLTLYIKKQLGGVSRTDLSELHMAAKRAEHLHTLEKSTQEKSGKRKDGKASSGQRPFKKGKASESYGRAGGSSKGKQSRDRPPRSGVSQSVAGPPRCEKCRRTHIGDCESGQLVCFLCGKPGHFARECRSRATAGASSGPQKNAQSGQGRPPQPQKTQAAPSQASNRMQTRLYAMTEEEAEASPGVVAGGE